MDFFILQNIHFIANIKKKIKPENNTAHREHRVKVNPRLIFAKHYFIHHRHHDQ